MQVNGCIALGTLDGVGALGQILPYGVQARSQAAIPVRTRGGHSAAQVVIGVAVGLCCLFLGRQGRLGDRGDCAALQQEIEGGQQQEQRRSDKAPCGSAGTLGGADPGTAGGAHNGARGLVPVAAAVMQMGGALLLGIAAHGGAAAGGPHAMKHILVIDAVVVGTFAPQGVGMFGRDGHAAFLTSAIDDPPAAQAAFLHGIASSFTHYTG